MILYSPVCLLPCKPLACWRGSRGPRSWCGHSSGACLRGKPRTCHHDGHSNRSAPEPAGGETRLVMRWGVLDSENRKKKNRQIGFWLTLSACVYSCFSDMNVCCAVSLQPLTVVCGAFIYFLGFLFICIFFAFLKTWCFRKLLPHQVGYQLTTNWWNEPVRQENIFQKILGKSRELAYYASSLDGVQMIVAI